MFRAELQIPLSGAFLILTRFFLPDFRITVGTNHSQNFNRIVLVVKVEMSHVREFLNKHTSDFFVTNGVNLRFFIKRVNMPDSRFLKSFAKSRLSFVIPISYFLYIGKGFRINLYLVFFHQDLSVFLASSQFKSLSGSFLTLSKRSITNFW